jgi:hypothetical protein
MNQGCGHDVRNQENDAQPCRASPRGKTAFLRNHGRGVHGRTSIATRKGHASAAPRLPGEAPRAIVHLLERGPAGG